MAILKTKIKKSKVYYYETDPTKLTLQIEKITKYSQRKQRLKDEIKTLVDTPRECIEDFIEMFQEIAVELECENNHIKEYREIPIMPLFDNLTTIISFLNCEYIIDEGEDIVEPIDFQY